ncbi:integrase core domain-containing protein [Candidatus Poribacteria bacterium]
MTEEALTGYYAALDVTERWGEYYNYRRPHSAIKYLVPADYYSKPAIQPGSKSWNTGSSLMTIDWFKMEI